MDGTVFLDITVMNRDAAFITIQHADGVAHIPIAKLSPELKRQLNYDPLKAAPIIAELKRSEEITQEAQAAQEQQERLEQRKVYIRAIVKEVEPGGVFIVDAVRYGKIKEEYKRLEPGKLGEGWKSKTSTFTKVATREIRMEGVSVFGLPANPLPGDSWAGFVWPAGERQIKNQAGMVTSMQPRYAASPELAQRLLELDRRSAGEPKKAAKPTSPFEKKPWK